MSEEMRDAAKVESIETMLKRSVWVNASLVAAHCALGGHREDDVCKIAREVSAQSKAALKAPVSPTREDVARVIFAEFNLHHSENWERQTLDDATDDTDKALAYRYADAVLNLFHQEKRDPHA